MCVCMFRYSVFVKLTHKQNVAFRNSLKAMPINWCKSERRMQERPKDRKQQRHVAVTCDTSKLVVGKSERKTRGQGIIRTNIPSSHSGRKDIKKVNPYPCGEFAYPLTESY